MLAFAGEMWCQARNAQQRVRERFRCAQAGCFDLRGSALWSTNMEDRGEVKGCIYATELGRGMRLRLDDKREVQKECSLRIGQRIQVQWENEASNMA